MEHNKINIRGILFDNITLGESEALIEDILLREPGSACPVYTPNAEIAQACIEDAALMEIINSAELVLPDGVGVIKAAKILGTPLKAKVAGVEFGELALKVAAKMGKKVFFCGGKLTCFTFFYKGADNVALPAFIKVLFNIAVCALTN